MSVMVNSFRAWMVIAPPGAEFPYHTGLLSLDREGNPAVEEIAEEVMAAKKQGLVLLLQRRLAPRFLLSSTPPNPDPGCLYVARRTRQPIPRVA